MKLYNYALLAVLCSSAIYADYHCPSKLVCYTAGKPDSCEQLPKDNNYFIKLTGDVEVGIYDFFEGKAQALNTPDRGVIASCGYIKNGNPNQYIHIYQNPETPLVANGNVTTHKWIFSGDMGTCFDDASQCPLVRR